MTLAEIFEQLYYGELSQTSIGVSTGNSGAMSEDDYPRIINFINRAVLAIHKKYLLIEKEVTIQLYDSITDYYLLDRYSITNVEDISPEIKYIIDSVETPFSKNRPLKILDVYDENGEPYTLNPTFASDALLEEIKNSLAFTPEQLRLQVPYPVSENAISLVCQAAPNNILTNVTDTTTLIELPDIFEEALLIHIAESYFGGQNQNKAEAQVYPNKFLQSCQQVEDANLLNVDQLMGGSRVREDGWA